MSQPVRVGPQPRQAAFGAGQFPGLVVDDEVDLERQRGEVGRGRAKQAPERREADVLEPAE
jgi:hypothetical protein